MIWCKSDDIVPEYIRVCIVYIVCIFYILVLLHLTIHRVKSHYGQFNDDAPVEPEYVPAMQAVHVEAPANVYRTDEHQNSLKPPPSHCPRRRSNGRFGEMTPQITILCVSHPP